MRGEGCFTPITIGGCAVNEPAGRYLFAESGLPMVGLGSLVAQESIKSLSDHVATDPWNCGGDAAVVMIDEKAASMLAGN